MAKTRKLVALGGIGLMLILSACETQTAQPAPPPSAAVTEDGCVPLSDPNPPAEDAKGNKALIGAGLGALAGIAAGAVIGGGSMRRNMAIGAGVGALAGAGIGHYMDRQEKELKQELANSDVDVTREGDQIILNMPSQVTFDVDSAEVSPAFYPVLEDIALVIRKYPNTYVDVIGHTDSTGTADHNLGLSQRRADGVADILISNCVQRGRLALAGAGETQPVASNDSRDGRAQNRRVEIKLTPITES